MDELRAAAAEVARRARSVRIDEAAVGPYARSLELAAVRAGGGSEPRSAWDRAEIAAFWLSLDAINFGSGWFPTLRKDPGRSGYATIAAAGGGTASAPARRPPPRWR